MVAAPSRRSCPSRPTGTALHSTFDRIFGGFAKARIAAGVVEGEAGNADPSRLLLRSADYTIKDEQILDDIRLVAERTKLSADDDGI